MKNVLKKLALILVIAMLVSEIQPYNVLAASKKYAKSLSVSKKTMRISVGNSKSLSYKVKVKGKASKKVTVKTSNPNVTVKKRNGKLIIYGKKEGKCRITVSTKAKNKRGKKIKKNIKITVVRKNTPTNTASPAKTSMPTQIIPTSKPVPTVIPTASVIPVPTPVPTKDTVVQVTKSEWIHSVMQTTGYNIQKDSFDYNESGNISYSFNDIAKDSNADMIETAVKYGIIPDSGGNFYPDAAADREFLAVTSVRAVGLALDDPMANYDDQDSLQYEAEDAVAIQLNLLELSNNKFLPDKAITKQEKQNAENILSDIIESRVIDKNHTDIIEYNEDVTCEESITSYAVSEKNGICTVEIPIGTSFDNVSENDKIVLPATNEYPEEIALVVVSNTLSSDGKNRVISGTIPEEMSEFVDSVDIEGEADAEPGDITAVDGVATVEVTKGSNEKQKLKKANADGEIDLKDKTKISYTIEEIETTVSFYLSALKYKVDFNKKGVNELYIGLPNVLSMDTEYKAKKNFSKKIGDIPIDLPAGLSANIELYLEAQISGEITMNLKLSNEVGVQYQYGQFYVIKSCEPSFDMVAKADADAGAKLQLGLYWMKGIMKVFGKEDPRPVYNVYTKWGLHGSALVHIRNDEYTSYENLTCIDLGYYLYGNVNVGNGSVLGDKFNLKKEWIIFDDKNSPLKGDMHIENGISVFSCSYNKENGSDIQFKRIYLLAEDEDTNYQGTYFSCDMDYNDNVSIYATYEGKTILIASDTRLDSVILTDGKTVFFTYIDYENESIATVYKMDLSNGNKTVIFSDKLSSYRFVLCGYYNNYLYYLNGYEPGGLYKYDVENKTKKEALTNYVANAYQYDKYFVVHTDECQDYYPVPLEIYNASTDELTNLSENILEHKVINNKIYMVKYKYNYTESDYITPEDCICDVVKCDLSGQNTEIVLSNIRIEGYISEITDTYIESTQYDYNTDTSQKHKLFYN